MGPLIFLPLIMLITITGSSSIGLFRHCDVSQCDAKLPPQFLQNLPPNKENLESVCPSLLEGVECFSSAIPRCTGHTIEELVAYGNATVVQNVRVFNNLKNLIQDLCDEENELSINYKATVICFKQSMEEHSMECHQEGETLYKEYIGKLAWEKLISLGEVNHADRPWPEVRCLSVAYDIACSLKAVQRNCGQVAKDTLQNIVRRVNSLESGICSESDILTLRGQFLDFLVEQGKERDFLSAVFEFRK